jgi:hypothetical protein
METQWANVLMLENAKGAILGVHTMNFTKGKTYHIDSTLAEIFIDMGVAAISGNPQNLQFLHVSEFGKKWGPEKDD